MTRIKQFCILVFTTNGFALNHDKKFANLLLLCKASSKKLLSERCRKHSNVAVRFFSYDCMSVVDPHPTCRQLNMSTSSGLPESNPADR